MLGTAVTETPGLGRGGQVNLQEGQYVALERERHVLSAVQPYWQPPRTDALHVARGIHPWRKIEVPQLQGQP